MIDYRSGRDSHFDQIDFIDCYTCEDSHFTNIQYNGVDCFRCDDATGEMRFCPPDDGKQYTCAYGDLCGYANLESPDCTVYCYGDCFSLSRTLLKGIPVRSNLYPLYYICIPWYLYLLYLIPYLIVWEYFDHYFNHRLIEKFNTIMILIDPSWIISKHRRDHIRQLQGMLHGNSDVSEKSDKDSKGAVAEIELAVIMGKSTNDNNSNNTGDNSDKDEHFARNNKEQDKVQNMSHVYRDFRDDYLIQQIAGDAGKTFKFVFDENDLKNGQTTWVKDVTDELSKFVSVSWHLSIPQGILDTIIDEYCCHSLLNVEINDQSVSQSQAELLLLYTKCVYLKNEYFEHYHKICKYLDRLSIFLFIKEMIVLISIVLCFFLQQKDLREMYNETWEYWQLYEQFISMVVNFYFAQMNPLFVFVCCRLLFFKRKDVASLIEDYFGRLKYIDKKNCKKNKKESGNDHELEIVITRRDKCNLFMSHYPNKMVLLQKYFFIKYFIFGFVVLLPFIFVVLFIVCFIYCCVGCKLPTINFGKGKIVIYILMFLSLIISVFCWINVYDAHMFIAAIQRGLVGTDQCPQTHTQLCFGLDCIPKLLVFLILMCYIINT